MVNKQICFTCGKTAYALHYGRCKSCFDEWAEKDSPEPDARKDRREYARIKDKGRRGHFLVKLANGLFFTPKRKANVAQSEAFVFCWFNTAKREADISKGIVIEIKPVGEVEK